MYSCFMSGDVNISDARARLPELIDEASNRHAPVYLAKRGLRRAAIIDADDLAHILELAEDMEDALAAEAAIREMRESGEPSIPWEQVRADLGLDG
jgi:prevent-host-death family protein